MIRKPTPSLSLSCARCFTRELLRSRIIIIVTIVVKVVKKEFHLAIEGLSQIAQSNERKWEQKKKQRKTAQSFTSQSETAKKNTMHVVHTSRQKKKKWTQKKQKRENNQNTDLARHEVHFRGDGAAAFSPFFSFPLLMKGKRRKTEYVFRYANVLRELQGERVRRYASVFCCWHEEKKKCEKEQRRWCDRQEKL